MANPIEIHVESTHAWCEPSPGYFVFGRNKEELDEVLAFAQEMIEQKIKESKHG